MRWYNTKPPVAGDTKSNSGFLLFPMTLEGETRWLEFATWTEEYVQVSTGDGDWDYFWNRVYWGTPKCPHGYQDWDDCPDCSH